MQKLINYSQKVTEWLDKHLVGYYIVLVLWMTFWAGWALVNALWFWLALDLAVLIYFAYRLRAVILLKAESRT